MIDILAKCVREKQNELDRWWTMRSADVLLPITSSVDIRNAGFKVSVVDTNLFPAGFNNLCNNFSKTAADHFKHYLATREPRAKKILLVIEAFTRNWNYLESVAAMKALLEQGGFQVAVGTPGEPLSQNPLPVKLPSGKGLALYQLEQKNRQLQTADFLPDVIVLNNDCTPGIPPVLENISQPIYPSPNLGWHSRRKKTHFELYCQLVEEVAKILGVDPWLFSPITHVEHQVDITEPKDMERLSQCVAKTLKEVKAKYEQYQIKEKPYVFVKSNTGTFGLGVMHVESPEEILSLNRKARQKLTASKGGTVITEFLVQEGVMTVDAYEGAPIEPIIYYVGGESIGGFFRIHKGKDARSSLNAPGATFECLCFHKIEEDKGNLTLDCEDHDNLFVVAKWLGKIASLAAGMESDLVL